ncbi:MAG: outer membrane beta-barrel protein [Planctomycetota bacterium]
MRGTVVALLLFALPTGAFAEEEFDPDMKMGLLLGVSTGQFDTDLGWSALAILDLTVIPPEELSGCRLMGELAIGYHHNSDNLDVVTSAILGPDTDVDLQSRTFHSMFGFKVVFEQVSPSFQPFLVAGPAYYAQEVELSNGRTLGQAPNAPELDNRGIPYGWGSDEWGGQVGAGVHIPISKRVELAIDARYHFVTDENNDFATFVAGFDFRF